MRVPIHSGPRTSYVHARVTSYVHARVEHSCVR